MDDAEERTIIQQMHDLATLLLGSYKAQLEVPGAASEQLVKEYQETRQQMIAPFADNPELAERAYLLAETHRDFQTLARLCERDNDQRRLDGYTERYGQAFTQDLFQFYLNEGKRTKLLQQPVQHGDALAQFLVVSAVRLPLGAPCGARSRSVVLRGDPLPCLFARPDHTACDSSLSHGWARCRRLLGCLAHHFRIRPGLFNSRMST